MTKNLRAQDITFILVKPRYGGNIGSTARVLKNMGFTRLHLVRPSVLPTHPEALRLAVGAADLLKRTKVFDSLQEATKGLRFLVGTSRRIGKYRRDFVTLPEIGSKLSPRQKVGILFGAEESGLSNRDLALCHRVVTIPSDPDFPSLNLAQSVALVAYQLRLISHGINSVADEGRFPPGHRINSVARLVAPVEEIEGMYRHLEKTLSTIGFLHEKNGFHMMRTIRQLFGRTGLTAREVRIVRGICRQVLWFDKKKSPTLG